MVLIFEPSVTSGCFGVLALIIQFSTFPRLQTHLMLL